MSMHKIPLTPIEESGLRAHGLDIGKPSQLSDAFRQGVRYASAQLTSQGGEAVAWIVTDMNGDSYFAYDRQTPRDTPLYAAPPAPSHGGGVAHTDCRSEAGITVGLIDSIITSCRVLSSRDLTCEAVVEALRDLQSDSDVSLIKPSHGEQVRAVPVKLLRSLLADLESGMMCNPDHGELSQLRELIGEQDHGI